MKSQSVGSNCREKAIVIESDGVAELRPVQNLGDAVVDEFHDISYGLRTFAFGRDQLVEQVVCNNVVALEVPCIRQELLHVVHE